MGGQGKIEPVCSGTLASPHMRFSRRFSPLPTALLTAFVIGSSPLAMLAQLPAPAAAQPAALDVQAMQKGLKLSDEGKYAEANKVLADLIKRFPYPTSQLGPQAHFRIGYNLFLMGEYDKSVDQLSSLSQVKGVDAETLELAAIMVPQISVAKAVKLPEGDKARDQSFEMAAKQYDAFIQKYPKSDEVESAAYGKGVSLFQVKKYEEAAAALQTNLQKFPQSVTIQDSQYLLGLTLTSLATGVAKASGKSDATTEQNYDKAEELLRDIIAKRQNLALLNDSQYQIGELLLARASFKPEDARKPVLDKALEAYRGVFPKDAVVAAQKARVAYFRELGRQAGLKQDVAGYKRNNRIADKEGEKLPTIEAAADLTVMSKIRSGAIFFQLSKVDEARVMLSFVEQFAEDPDSKKQIAYYITVSYAVQNKIEEAEKRYQAFTAAYKADPIAENLDLLMGGPFLTPDPKTNNPQKAIEYFERGLAAYPKGQFASELVMQKAMALIQLQKFDEALGALKGFLASNPPKELAVSAEYGLAVIYKETGKLEDSISTFRSVRDKYGGTPEAEEAAYYVGQLLLATAPKDAVAELNTFLSKYPNSKKVPEALLALGQAQLASNQRDAAFKTFKELADKHPDSQTAPFSYFDRARALVSEQKFDEVMTLMNDFIAKYADHSTLYLAYDFKAQILTSQSKGTEAIATYEEFVKKKPQAPEAPEALVKLSSLWKGYAEGQGPFLSLDEKKRGEWKKGVESSTAASEKIISDYPDSSSVALALDNLLEILRLQERVKLKTAADTIGYFEALAAKSTANAGLASKIQFLIAGILFNTDKAKALQTMEKVFDEKLKYGALELDLYGMSLIENKKYDQALKIYKKIAEDYPIPANTEPTKASRDIQDAQAISLFGLSKTFQAQGMQKESSEKSEELQKLYPWHERALEANYPIALQLHTEKKDEDAIQRLLAIAKAQKASPELRAKSMLLLGKIHEANSRFDFAIDNYIKIAAYYGGVADVAAEGLFLGAQLQEKQGSGAIPMPTPAPKATPGPKSADATPKPGAATPKPAGATPKPAATPKNK